MLESFITSINPDILASLLQELGNWLYDIGEVQNEPSIIASQPKETSYHGHGCWRLPFQDLVHLARVHLNSFW
jgi:hypothetical protein